MRVTPLILFIFILLCCDNLLSQSDTSVSFANFGTSNLSIGTVQGIHPNLRNGGFSCYVYGELSQELTIKGVPLKFNGRLSNEALRIGQPSYFQFSFDNARMKDLTSIYSKEYKESKELDLKNQEAEKYKLEGQLSFKKEMLRRLKLDNEKYSKNDLDSLNPSKYSIPDSLTGDYSIPDYQKSLNDSLNGNLSGITGILNTSIKPSISDSLNGDYKNAALQNKRIDSLSKEISGLTDSLNIANTKYDSLSAVVDGLQKFQKYDALLDKFKLKRFNLGLTSLSRSGLSNNAIPIQGIHAEGIYKNTFYDLSAGMTQPFQNFNTQVFNELTTGSQNVFNVNEFYKTKKMRVVTSTIFGIGDRNKDNWRLEHFYLGKSFEAIKKKRSEEFSNTINTAGEYSVLKNLKMGYLFGISLLGNDTLNSKVDVENLAYKGTIVYTLPKTRSFLEMEYRTLGSKYDGNSQGILINGTNHRMVGYTKSIFKHSKISVKYIEDRFQTTDSIVLFNRSKKVFAHLSLRINANNKLQSTYSYIRGSGSEIGSKAGQLATLTYINQMNVGSNQLVNTVQGGYTRMPSRSNYQEISQVSASSQYYVGTASFALKGTYEKYEGLQQFWGENYVIEPSVGYSNSKGEILFAVQYSKSRQFGEDYGVNMRARFSPSPYITWQFTAQKWMSNERALFLYQAPSSVSSWYLDVKIIVNLNIKK